MVRGDDLPQDQDSGQTPLPILNALAGIRHECEANDVKEPLLTL